MQLLTGLVCVEYMNVLQQQKENQSNSNHFRYIFQLHHVYGRVVSR